MKPTTPRLGAAPRTCCNGSRAPARWPEYDGGANPYANERDYARVTRAIREERQRNGVSCPCSEHADRLETLRK
jgi:hypothetical protein